MNFTKFFGAAAIGATIAGCATPSQDQLAAPTDRASINWGSKDCQEQMVGRSDARKVWDKGLGAATSLNTECVAINISSKNNPTWTTYGQMFTPNCNTKAQSAFGTVTGIFSASQKAEATEAQRACAADKAALRSLLWGKVASEKADYITEYNLAPQTEQPQGNRRGSTQATVPGVSVAFESTADISELTTSQGRAATPSSGTPAVPAEIRRNVPGVRDAERIYRNPGSVIQRMTR